MVWTDVLGRYGRMVVDVIGDMILRMDAIQACQVGPSDEWSRATKDGYNQAATDIAMNMLRIPAAITLTPTFVDDSAGRDADVKALVEAATAYVFENDCYDEDNPTAMAAWRSARTKLDEAIAAMEGKP